MKLSRLFMIFFFNDTATTEIYTLSLHDALPIYPRMTAVAACQRQGIEQSRHALIEDGTVVSASLVTERTCEPALADAGRADEDRKSTRLHSSHTVISYAVFCLYKKK